MMNLLSTLPIPAAEIRRLQDQGRRQMAKLIGAKERVAAAQEKRNRKAAKRAQQVEKSSQRASP